MTESILVASKYREITLQNVPMCNRCASGKAVWYISAAIATAIGTVALYFSEPNDPSSAVPWLYGLAVVLAIVATRRGALRILSFDESRNAIRVELYSAKVAQEMAAREARRPESREHIAYLQMQKEKKRKERRELVRVMRIVCFLGIAGGLYILQQSNMSEGFSLLIITGAIWIPFELIMRRGD